MATSLQRRKILPKVHRPISQDNRQQGNSSFLRELGRLVDRHAENANVKHQHAYPRAAEA